MFWCVAVKLFIYKTSDEVLRTAINNSRYIEIKIDLNHLKIMWIVALLTNSFTETHIIETLCSGCVLVVLIELGVAFIDLVILSFATEDCDIADVKRLWGVLEEFVDQGKIDSLGTADLLLADLTDLYEASKAC